MTASVKSSTAASALPRVRVWSGTAIAVTMAVAIFVTRSVGMTAPTALRVEGLLGSLAFAVLLAGPGWLAARTLRSGERGPLLPALLLVVLVTFASFSVFVVGGLLVAILWAAAFVRWPTSGAKGWARVAMATVGAVVLGVAAIAALFVHVDPYCWQQVRLDAGEAIVRRVPARAASGLAWQIDEPSRMGQSIPADSNVVSSGCGSDRVVPGEAAASILAGGIALTIAARSSGP